MRRLAELLAFNLERIRLDRGWSKTKLAVEAGVLQQTMSLYLNKKANVEFSTVESIALKLGIAPLGLLLPPDEKSKSVANHAHGEDAVRSGRTIQEPLKRHEGDEPQKRDRDQDDAKSENTDRPDPSIFDDLSKIHAISSALAAELATALRSEVIRLSNLSPDEERMLRAFRDASDLRRAALFVMATGSQADKKEYKRLRIEWAREIDELEARKLDAASQETQSPAPIAPKRIR